MCRPIIKLGLRKDVTGDKEAEQSLQELQRSYTILVINVWLKVIRMNVKNEIPMGTK